MPPHSSDASWSQELSRLQRAMIAIGLVLFVLCFWWTGQHMWLRWWKEGSYYSHGILVPAVSVVLLWMRRQQLATLPRRPSPWGLILLVPGLVMHLAGVALHVGFFSGFGMITVFLGLVWTCLGLPILRHTLFPIVFLAFMVPLPEVLIEKVSFNMKLMAAATAAKASNLLGVVAVRDGSILNLPPTQYVPEFQRLVVDDVCSGLKYLISLTAFGALYAYISRLRLHGKLILFVLSIPLSFVANVLRVILMTVVAWRWGVEQVEAWYFHDLFGFLLFVFAFCFLFLVESLLLRLPGMRLAAESSAEEAESQTPGEEGGDREKNKPRRALPSASSPTKVHILALALLALTAGFSLFLSRPGTMTPVSGILAGIPRQIGQWRGNEIEISDYEKRILGTEDVISIQYSNPQKEDVHLLIVLAQQARKRTHPPEQCYRGEGFARQSSSTRSIRLGRESDRKPIDVRQVVFERTGKTKLVWYFYKNGSQTSTSYWKHQMTIALAHMVGRHPVDTLIRFDTTLAAGQSVAEGEKRLRFFAEEALPAIIAELP